MFTIEEVKDEDQKMAVVDEVLKDLPEWFGIPESTQAYIEGAKDLQACPILVKSVQRLIVSA